MSEQIQEQIERRVDELWQQAGFSGGRDKSSRIRPQELRSAQTLQQSISFREAFAHLLH